MWIIGAKSSSSRLTLKRWNLRQTVKSDDNLLKMGEVNLAGDRGLKRTKFSSFFPSENSPFSDLAEDTPKGYITMLDEGKHRKKGSSRYCNVTWISIWAMLMMKLNYLANEGTRIFIIPCLFQSTLLFERPNGKYNAKSQRQWPYRSAQYQRRWKPYRY